MDTQEGAILEAMEALPVRKPKKPKAKKKKAKVKKPAAKKAAKPKAKKKAKVKKPKAQPVRFVVRTERLDMRLSKAEKAKVTAKAKKARRTVTSIVYEAIEKLK